MCLREWNRKGDLPKHLQEATHMWSLWWKAACEPPSLGWLALTHLPMPTLTLISIVGLLSALRNDLFLWKSLLSVYYRAWLVFYTSFPHIQSMVCNWLGILSAPFYPLQPFLPLLNFWRTGKWLHFLNSLASQTVPWTNHWGLQLQGNLEPTQSSYLMDEELEAQRNESFASPPSC